MTCEGGIRWALMTDDPPNSTIAVAIIAPQHATSTPAQEYNYASSSTATVKLYWTTS